MNIFQNVVVVVNSVQITDIYVYFHEAMVGKHTIFIQNLVEIRFLRKILNIVFNIHTKFHNDWTN